MDIFEKYITGSLEQIGYKKQDSASGTHSIRVTFKSISQSVDDTFHVMYIRQPPDNSDEVKGVFDFYKKPMLFVIDHQAMADDLLAFVQHGKALPLWIRALHAIYYGRIYTWFASERTIKSLHFDWDKHDTAYSEAIEIDRVILTETDSLLRDYPGHFKIARFSDRAFWKGERPQKPPKREQRNGPTYEEWIREEFKRYQGYGHTPPRPPPEAESIYEMFERLKREEMRRRQSQQQQTYNQRPNRYASTNDKWLIMLLAEGTLDGAKKKFRELAHQYHPDKAGDSPEVIETMQLINAAYAKAKTILS